MGDGRTVKITKEGEDKVKYIVHYINTMREKKTR